MPPIKIQDTDLLLVQRDNQTYKVTAEDLSLTGAKPINPSPDDITISPPTTGNGTEGDPYILTSPKVDYGKSINTDQTITISNQRSGDLVVFTDLNANTNGERYNQAVDIIPPSGIYSKKLLFIDAPKSDTEKDLVGILTIGSLPIYFRWEVDVRAPVFAPIVNSVTLVGTGTDEGKRFEDQSFASNIALTEGNPVSTKSIGYKVAGTLYEYLETSEIVGAGSDSTQLTFADNQDLDKFEPGLTITQDSGGTPETSAITVANSSSGAWIAGAGDGSSTTSTDKTFKASAFGNNKFIAIDSFWNTLYSTDNAVTWTRQRIGANNATSNAITYGNGRFVAVGGNGAASQAPICFVQLDGSSTWNSYPMPGYIQNSLANTVAYGNGIFVAISGYSLSTGFWTSTDGETWSSPVNSDSVLLGSGGGRLAFGDGYFLVGGKDGALYSSTNGTTWSSSSSGIPSAMYVSDIAYGNGVWVAVGYNQSSGAGYTYYSTNRTSWSSVSGLPSRSGSAVIYGEDTFMWTSGSSPGGTYVSKDPASGFSATPIQPVASEMRTLIYGNGLWVYPVYSNSNSDAAIYWNDSVNGPFASLTLTNDTNLANFRVGDVVQGNLEYEKGLASTINIAGVRYSGGNITSARLREVLDILGKQSPDVLDGTLGGSTFPANNIYFKSGSYPADETFELEFLNTGTYKMYFMSTSNNEGAVVNLTYTGGATGPATVSTPAIPSGSTLASITVTALPATILIDDGGLIAWESPSGDVTTKITAISESPASITTDGGTWSNGNTITGPYIPAATGTVGSIDISANTITLSSTGTDRWLITEPGYEESKKLNKTVVATKIVDNATAYLETNSNREVTGKSFAPVYYDTFDTTDEITFNLNPGTGRTWDKELPDGTTIQACVSADNTTFGGGRSPEIGTIDSNVLQPEAVFTISDLFATTLYNGNGASQTITNGIDLSSGGGLVWTKCRDIGRAHSLVDTVRGVNRTIESNAVNPADIAGTVSSFYSNGYEALYDGTSNNTNVSGNNYVSWCFRKAPKFFDIQTWIGDGTSGLRYLDHNLTTPPAVIITKKINSTGDWFTYHKDTGVNYYLTLNVTDKAADAGSQAWDATNTQFAVSSQVTGNGVGSSWVAYLFADEPGLIKCGSYVGNGTAFTVDCGFKPQWVLIKSSTYSGGTASEYAHWFMMDSKRNNGNSNSNLGADVTTEDNGSTLSCENSFTDNGFQVSNSGNPGLNQGGETFIYIAIAAPVVRNLTQAEVNATKLLLETTDYRKCKHICDLTARGAELRASLQAAGYTTPEIDNLLDLTSIPIALNGYYPLYTTEAEADAAGNGSSHAHTVDSVVYYMPDGGTAIYHGTYGS